MKIHLTLKSSNVKTGPIPVSTQSRKTCPPECPMIRDCYASSGPLAIHWSAVTDEKRGVSLPEFTQAIATLPTRQLWRWGQAGDLLGEGSDIDVESMDRILEANRGKRGFTYTHKPLNEKNLSWIEKANREGFTVNISTNSVRHAIETVNKGPQAPVVTLLPSDHTAERFERDGVQFRVCPAQIRDNIDCSKCGLCALPKRPFVIGFIAHGTKAKKVSEIANSY